MRWMYNASKQKPFPEFRVPLPDKGQDPLEFLSELAEIEDVESIFNDWLSGTKLRRGAEALRRAKGSAEKWSTADVLRKLTELQQAGDEKLSELYASPDKLQAYLRDRLDEEQADKGQGLTLEDAKAKQEAFKAQVKAYLESLKASAQEDVKE